MASIRSFLRSFSGGEISSEMYGRIDDAKFQTGLACCRNFIVKPHGPVENRPGFEFVRLAWERANRVRLIPFTYSTTQTLVIEMGAGYFRFHTQGGTVMDGVMPYDVSTPYAEEDLADVHYVQSADVLTLVHPNHAPRELRRMGATDWQLKTLSFAASIAPPTSVAATPAGLTAPKYSYSYVVTAVNGVSESGASLVATTRSNLFETGCINTITWQAAPGATQYNVFKLQGGLFGYIGQTSGTSLIDENIAPDLSKTPPIHDGVFVPNGIASVSVFNGGSGYGTAVGGGKITSVEIKNAGTGWSVESAPPTISVSDATGSGAKFKANLKFVTEPLTGWTLVSVDVLDPGSDYSAPILYLESANGVSGVVLVPVVTPRDLPSPSLKVSDPTGHGAALSPVIENGVIKSVVVANAGSGYSSPTITVDPPAGGSGAVFGGITLTGQDYPGAVSYFEQRRCFAGTTKNPQNIWMTKSGTESDMSYSLPVRDDDRIAFRVAAREANTIRHIVPLTQLLLLTSSAEWRVSSVNSDAITPSSISVRPQSYVGASNVQPAIINNTLIFGAARGGHVRELAYNWQANGFITGDLSLRAPHLFDTFDIVDMAYAKAPQPIVWFISSSGLLLGLTYVPEQQVGAWHWHDTDGVFESCAVVAEGGEDVLYCVVRRTIDDVPVRIIERMHSRQFSSRKDAFFVDCGSTYQGVPADEISGLSHLEGKTVSVLADGAVHPQRVVTAGKITLDVEARTVHVGLPIEADLETLPLAAQLQDGSFGQGHAKAVNKVWLRVHRSSGIFVGPNAQALTEAKQRTTEPYGAPPDLKSEEIPIVLPPAWASGGQIFVRQSDPLPLTVVSLTAEVAVGG